MWLCPKCQEKVEDNYDICWNCLTERDAPQITTGEKADLEATLILDKPNNQYEDDEIGKFFSFRTMVSKTLIQIIYIIGMFGVSTAGIYIITQAAISKSGSSEEFIMGSAILILGNLIWRIICEVWILLFNIHDVLCSMNETSIKRSQWESEERP
jgi:hypothetical protein